MQPGDHPFAGLENFHYFVTDPDFWPAVWNTLLLIGSVIVITVVLGVLLALLVNEPFPGRGIVRVLLISPFFVMPTVNALLWKHMMMNPIYGVLADVWRVLRRRAGRLADRRAAALGDHHGGLAVAALRLPDLHHLAAVARPRADGGGAHGRRQRRSSASATSRCRTWAGRWRW